MLEALRRGIGTWFAKIFIGLLVLSFAVWGIADIFGGYGRRTVATVGDTEISYEQYQEALQGQMRALGTRFGRSLTLEEARALGVDRQVLVSLLQEAALDNQGAELGLGVSDAAIAERILRERMFQDTSGRFSRAIFEQLLRANGLSEASFVARQRQAYTRQQMTVTVGGAVEAPRTLLRAAEIYRNQTRRLKYFLLPLAQIDPIEAPTAETLQSHFDANKTAYTSPEYRKIGVLSLLPGDLAKTIAIPEDQVKAAYENELDRYRTQEKRTVQQIPFPDKAAAQAAYEKIKAGTTFEDLARERALSDEDLALGTVTKGDLADRVIADTAFSLAADTVSAPVAGTLNTVLLRVTNIEPGSVTAFDEVKATIRERLALDQAVDRIIDTHGKVEDERAAGTTLEEIAKTLTLDYRLVDAVSSNGTGQDGKPIAEIPSQPRLLRDAFRSDVGVENDPIETPDQGLVWFEVIEVIPERQKTFDEVRDQVATDWRAAEERARLAKKAQALMTRGRQGESLDDLATGLGLQAKQSEPIKRDGSTDDIPRTAVAQAFALSQDGWGAASAEDGKAQIVFQVTGIEQPGPPDTEASKALEAAIAPRLADDLVSQYVIGLSEQYGITRNTPLINQLTGAAPADDTGRRRGSY